LIEKLREYMGRHLAIGYDRDTIIVGLSGDFSVCVGLSGEVRIGYRGGVDYDYQTQPWPSIDEFDRTSRKVVDVARALEKMIAADMNFETVKPAPDESVPGKN